MIHKINLQVKEGPQLVMKIIYKWNKTHNGNENLVSKRIFKQAHGSLQNSQLHILSFYLPHCLNANFFFHLTF